MKTRLLSLLLAVLMCGGSLVGCGSAPVSQQASPSVAAPSGPADPNKPMYPIEGNVTLDYWMPINNNATKHITSYADSEAYREVQKQTGVKINFIHPVAGQEKEQFNLMMASGELPDIIQAAQLYEGGELKGYTDGAYIDLTPYLEEYAPDYYRIITSDPEIKREVFTEDGKVIAFYKIQPDPLPPWCRAIVRKDWLEEFGMSEPMTFDEYEAYMQAVLEKKPGTVPFMLPKHGAGSSASEVEVFYGAFNLLPEWFVSDGKVRYGNGDPELKNYLTLMNDWYKKGYISKDFPALDAKQVWAEFDTGKIGMYVDSVDAMRTRTIEAGVNAIGTPYPRPNKDSKLHCLLASWPRAGDITAVSSGCDNIEAAIKFLNYAYTDEGSMVYNYGIEGKTYTMVDGKPKYTDYVFNNPNFGTEAANYILRIHFAPKYMPGTPLEFNPSIAKDADAVANRMRFCDDPNTDNAYRLPPISLSSDESAKRAEIMTNIKTYSDEMILKFIIGTEPLENFDKYMEQLNKYGMQEAIALTQAAYDRYVQK